MNCNPISVKLSEPEMGQAGRLATLRSMLSRACGIEDKLIDPSRSGQEADLLGMKAEIAVAKLLDIPLTSNELGVDNGCDLYLNLGSREVGLQVKATHHPQGQWMLGTPHGKLSWSVSVLVRATDQSNIMQVYGWINRNNYQNKIQDIKLNGKPAQGVHIDDLLSIEMLWRKMMSERLA